MFLADVIQRGCWPQAVCRHLQISNKTDVAMWVAMMKDTQNHPRSVVYSEAKTRFCVKYWQLVLIDLIGSRHAWPMLMRSRGTGVAPTCKVHMKEPCKSCPNMGSISSTYPTVRSYRSSATLERQRKHHIFGLLCVEDPHMNGPTWKNELC